MDTPSWNEFKEYSRERIAQIVEENGRPRSVLFEADGSRRVLGFNSEDTLSQEEYWKAATGTLLEILAGFYEHGIRTVFLASFSQKCFTRDRQYVDFMMLKGIRYFCSSDHFLDFFKKHGIRVRFYGNSDFVKEQGYAEILEWMDNLHDTTADYGPNRLYIAFAEGMNEEEVRAAEMGIDFYKTTNRIPTRNDLLQNYYGDIPPMVDMFIHPSEVRDSDCQPLFLGGRAEMYFSTGTMMGFDELTLRTILYDYLFHRIYSSGNRSHEQSSDDAKYLKGFYEENMHRVLGIGKRSPGGEYWLPRFSGRY